MKKKDNCTCLEGPAVLPDPEAVEKVEEVSLDQVRVLLDDLGEGPGHLVRRLGVALGLLQQLNLTAVKKTNRSQLSNAGFIFVRTFLVQNGECPPFLKLTPTL